MALFVTWLDGGHPATQAPDPAHPLGVDVDVAEPEGPACKVALPYPAPRVGMWFVKCETCWSHSLVTAAGRTDDPRSVRLPCKTTAG